MKISNNTEFELHALHGLIAVGSDEDPDMT